MALRLLTIKCGSVFCILARIVSIIPLLFIISGCDPEPDGSLEGSPQRNLGMDDKLQFPSNNDLARRVMRPLVEYGPGFAKKDAQPFDHRHAVNKLKKLFKLKWKLYGNAPKTSTAANLPSTTTIKPSTTTSKSTTTTTKPSPKTSKPSTTTTKPSTTTRKPSTTSRKTSTTTSKPSTTTIKQSTTTRKPTTTTTRKPSTTTSKTSTTSTSKPSKTTSRPSTIKSKPSTTTRKPSTTKRKPSTTASKSKTVTPLKVIVNNKNKKQTSNKSLKTKR